MLLVHLDDVVVETLLQVGHVNILSLHLEEGEEVVLQALGLADVGDLFALLFQFDQFP